MNNFDQAIICKETITARQGFEGPMNRSNVITDSAASHFIHPSDMRIFDNQAIALAAPALSDDDLGLAGGAHGTGCIYVTTGDLNGLASKTRKARFSYQLPINYVAGSTVYVNFAAGILASSNVAATSCTVDVEVYKFQRDGLKSGADLCTTSAVTMNSTTFGDKTFTLTSTGLLPEDILDILVIIIGNHNSTGTSCIPCLAVTEVLHDRKG